MQIQKLGVFIVLMLMISSCQSNKMLGLWQVEKVSIGEQEMTPVGRWMRFEEKGKQSSGNGWRQHSIGNWTLADAKLKIKNSNGYKEDYPAFELRMDGEKMYWEREEDGNKVKILWRRIDELPQTPADQLLGVWKLTAASKSIAIVEDNYIYFAWDQRFRGKLLNQKIKGIYQVHAHKNQLKTVARGEEAEDWKFSLNKDATQLEIETKDIQLTFQRIDYFPDSNE